MKLFVFIYLCICTIWVCSQELMVVDSESETEVSESSEPFVSNSEVFVPTEEWQVIKPGQAIPRGLHVRVNMQTGLKEAKLLDKSEVKTPEPSTPEPSNSFKFAELKEALQNIKNDMSSEESNTIKNKFRTAEQLKEDLEDLQVKVESEVEIIQKLVRDFQTAESDSDRVEILQTLEFYVHQYDNALDFLTLDGVERILVPSLNSSLEELQEAAGFLIGSAAQSNPRVQIAFLEAGFINTLLRLVTANSSPLVSGKALYGLSAIIRNFPEAQNTFLRNGGLDVLKQVFKFQGKLFDKLKIKILTLVQDLLDERMNLDPSSQEELKRLEQYSRIDLQSILSSTGWCEVFQDVLVLPKEDRRAKRDDILSTVSDDYPVRTEHDAIEKILTAMSRMTEQCRDQFLSNKELKDKLVQLSEQYDELSARERVQQDPDTFFTSLLQTILLILPKDAAVKTEL